MTNVSTLCRTTPLAAPAPRWTVLAAHAVPLCVLPSGLWRIFTALLSPAIRAAGAGQLIYIVVLSIVSESLALLSLGLVRPWGEVLPRVVPFLGGRAIPARLVVVVASTGAVALFAAYGYFFLNGVWWHIHFAPAIGNANEGSLPSSGPSYWIFLASYLPLLAWAPLLTALTIAYHRRTRQAKTGQ